MPVSIHTDRNRNQYSTRNPRNSITYVSHDQHTGTEIACNLLDVQVTSPADLVRRVEQIIAHQRDVRAHQDNMQGSDVPGGDVQGRDVQGGDVQGDVRIIRDYCINPPPATLVQEAQALIRGH